MKLWEEIDRSVELQLHVVFNPTFISPQWEIFPQPKNKSFARYEMTSLLDQALNEEAEEDVHKNYKMGHKKP